MFNCHLGSSIFKYNKKSKYPVWGEFELLNLRIPREQIRESLYLITGVQTITL